MFRTACSKHCHSLEPHVLNIPLFRTACSKHCHCLEPHVLNIGNALSTSICSTFLHWGMLHEQGQTRNPHVSGERQKKTNYSSTTLTNQESKFFDPQKRCKYGTSGPNRRLQSTRANFLMQNELGNAFLARFGKNVKIVKNSPEMTRSSKWFLVTKPPGNSQPQMKIGANDSESSCATC